MRDPNLTPDPNRIRDFLQQVKARSRARSQFERARLGNESLLDWLDRTYQQTSQKGESLYTALLLLQGCATWTQQDTAILMSALAAGIAGVAIGSAMTPQYRYSSLPSAYEANQNAAVNYQLWQINNHLADQQYQQQLQQYLKSIQPSLVK